MALRDILIALALLPHIVADNTCEGENLALKKTVFQSNEIQPGTFATDDETDTDSALCSRANSTTNENPWLVVDLGKPYLISFVTFFNPQMGVPLGVSVKYTFVVSMSTADPRNPPVYSAECGSSVLNVDGWVWVEISCVPVVWGRYVRLQKLGSTEILSVCEIAIYPARRASMISNRKAISWRGDVVYPGSKQSAPFIGVTNGSRVVCVSICHEFPGCAGFNFNGGLCEFFGGTISTVTDTLWEMYLWE